MRAALLLALRLTLLVVSIRALCPAEENARLRPYAAAVCLLAGLVRVELPFGVPLAAVEAAAVCLLADSMEDALLIGAACGLVLDLGSVPSPPQTACFLPAASRLPDGKSSPNGAGSGVCGALFSVRACLGRGACGLDVGRAGGRGSLMSAPRLYAAGYAAGRTCRGKHARADGGRFAADGDKAVPVLPADADGPGADLRQCSGRRLPQLRQAPAMLAGTCGRYLPPAFGLRRDNHAAGGKQMRAIFPQVSARSASGRRRSARPLTGRCARRNRSCWRSNAARKHERSPARCSVSLHGFCVRQDRSAPIKAFRATSSRLASGRSGCGAIRSAATAEQAFSAARPSTFCSATAWAPAPAHSPTRRRQFPCCGRF